MTAAAFALTPPEPREPGAFEAWSPQKRRAVVEVAHFEAHRATFEAARQHAWTPRQLDGMRTADGDVPRVHLSTMALDAIGFMGVMGRENAGELTRLAMLRFVEMLAWCYANGGRAIAGTHEELAALVGTSERTFRRYVGFLVDAVVADPLMRDNEAGYRCGDPSCGCVSNARRHPRSRTGNLYTPTVLVGLTLRAEGVRAWKALRHDGGAGALAVDVLREIKRPAELRASFDELRAANVNGLPPGELARRKSASLASHRYIRRRDAEAHAARRAQRAASRYRGQPFGPVGPVDVSSSGRETGASEWLATDTERGVAAVGSEQNIRPAEPASLAAPGPQPIRLGSVVDSLLAVVAQSQRAKRGAPDTTAPVAPAAPAVPVATRSAPAPTVQTPDAGDAVVATPVRPDPARRLAAVEEAARALDAGDDVAFVDAFALFRVMRE